MKQLFFSLTTALVMSMAVSCSSAEKEKTEESEHHEAYQCPMKCEGDKTYNEPGKCPKCNMDLTKVEHHHHEH